MSDKPHPAAIDVAGAWYLSDAKASLVPVTMVSRPDLPEPQRHQELNYHLNKGESAIRVPIRWERIQKVLFGPLVSAGTLETWSGRLDMDRIDEMIAHVTGRGCYFLFDLHNYMKYTGIGHVGYGDPVPPEALVDLWEKLANRYASNSRVIYNLMNEPEGIGAADNRDIMEWLVNAIRLRTPALNEILVSGNANSGAAAWVSGGNAAAFEGFADPANNFGFDMHQYFDSDSTGTKGICMLNAQDRVKAAMTWARSKGYKIHLGEFAGGDPGVSGQEQCANVVPAVCALMYANRDVFSGWTAWGAGLRWQQNYIFRAEPYSYVEPVVDTPQYKLVLPFFVPIA